MTSIETTLKSTKTFTPDEKIEQMRDPNFALFRPYNITRRAHVVFAFKNIKTVSPTGVETNRVTVGK